MKVSCLVSAYYATPYIASRVRNLLEQDGVSFEVLVACQKDGPEHDILKEFEESVIIVTTANIPTLYATWNLLIRNSSGEYITNSNSDDILYPGGLWALAKILDESPEVGLVYGNDDVVKQYGGDPVNRHLWPSGTFFDLVHGCFIGPMPMWRSSLHEKYGYFDEEMTSAGDYEFWLRIFAGGEIAMHTLQTVGAYLKRDDSLENRQSLITTVETARARSRYVDWRTLYDK